MKKVLYLHGLESKQGGPKVEFLRTKGIVYAPEMDYRSLNFNEQVLKIIKFRPDLVIGSSMGGYVAHLIANYIGIPSILFNPAFHSRSFEPNIDSKYFILLSSKVKHMVVLGKQDKIIDPNVTKLMLQEQRNYSIYEREFGHRTSLSNFINFYTMYENRIK